MSVLTTSLSTEHKFPKECVDEITLIRDRGVEGDCHSGQTVQHLSRMKIQPPPANLRQVHLIPNEILAERGVKPAEIGENIATVDIDLLGLGRGTKLHFVDGLGSVSKDDSDGHGNDVPSAIGEQFYPQQHSAASYDVDDQAQSHAVVVVQGLRNPCWQIDNHCKGLQEKFLVRDEAKKIIGRTAGIMCTVERGGVVRPGMKIMVEESRHGWEKLDVV